MDPSKVDPGGIDPGNDLPLMANTSDILVRHYILDLSVNFAHKTFSGSIILFTEPSPPKQAAENPLSSANTRHANTDHMTANNGSEDDRAQFCFILDSCDISVDAVEEVLVETDEKAADLSTKQVYLLHELLDFPEIDCEARRKKFWACRGVSGGSLCFSVEPWCLRVWKKGVRDARHFPRIVRVHYSTKPSGTSVTWTKDQDNNECVFTQGAWINNRALYPCQEPPVAMASWQAIITTTSSFTVLMSGDNQPVIKHLPDGHIQHYYYVDTPVPCSMFAIAIGQWQRAVLATPPTQDSAAEKNSNSGVSEGCWEGCNHTAWWPCRMECTDQPIIACHLVAPSSLIQRATEEFSGCVPRYLQAVFHLLGPHPYNRIDILVVPKCFASMGLASPCLIFVSQSLLAGDGSLCIRLAHEMSHSWFGLLIGARDWTEEWMSEGFATYMEDLIHGTAHKWSEEKKKQHADLRSLIRYRILEAEIANTQAELQTLRPNGRGREKRGDGGDGSLDTTVTFVKNGLNADKGFMQVHYIKGYFLLRYLAQLVGQDRFNRFIKKYVKLHHCQQVLSEQLFQLYFEEFPEIEAQGITMELIYEQWLDASGMPPFITEEMFSENNHLVIEAKKELEKWLALEKSITSKRKTKRAKKAKYSHDQLPIHFQQMESDQKIILLEWLLERKKCSHQLLKQLHTSLDMPRCNAEVVHRWCELVIKHKYVAHYQDIKTFLIQHQAMGVYLYGELILSKSPRQYDLAEECFNMASSDMDKGCHRTVYEMLYTK